MMAVTVVFFSSRRRHTRLQGDWSSDVCSSDLQPPEDGARGHRRHADLLNHDHDTRRHAMNFLDGHLFPENQQPLIITAAPYAPSWLPSDFPGEIAVTLDEQIQKAVDCYNAGATVLHLHVRELDRKSVV